MTGGPPAAWAHDSPEGCWHPLRPGVGSGRRCQGWEGGLSPAWQLGHMTATPPGCPRGLPCLGARTLVVSGTQAPSESSHRLTGKGSGTRVASPMSHRGALGFPGEGAADERPSGPLAMAGERGRHVVPGKPPHTGERFSPCAGTAGGNEGVAGPQGRVPLPPLASGGPGAPWLAAASL